MSVGARRVGAGQEQPLPPSAAPQRSADFQGPAPVSHGADNVRSDSAGRRALTVVAAISACAAVGLTCAPVAGTAAAGVSSASAGAVHASVPPGPAARISTVAMILPADAAPASGSSTPTSAAAPSAAAPSAGTPSDTPSSPATPTATPAATPTPSASPSATATPSSSPTATPSPKRPKPTPKPSRTPSAPPSAQPSPTTSATAGSPDPVFAPVVDAQSATPSLAVITGTQTRQPRGKNRPQSPAASASAAAPSSSQSPLQARQHIAASTIDDTANTSPPVAAIAVTVAALGALAGCAFVFARHRPRSAFAGRRPRFALAWHRPRLAVVRHRRGVQRHSHRAPRRRSRRSSWR